MSDTLHFETLHVLIQDRLENLHHQAECARLLGKRRRTGLSLRLGRWRLKLEPLERCVGMRRA